MRTSDNAVYSMDPTTLICYARAFYFNKDILMLFLHNSYVTSEFSDCGNLVGAVCMGNLRWANTEPTMHFRKTNTDPPVHFRKTNTDPSMHFRKANTEFLLPIPNSQFYFSLSQHNYQFVIPWWVQHNFSSNRILRPLYSLCFVHSFLFWSKVASLKFQANWTCRKDWKIRMFARGGHPSK